MICSPTIFPFQILFRRFIRKRTDFFEIGSTLPNGVYLLCWTSTGWTTVRGSNRYTCTGKMVIEVTQIEVHLERLSKTRYSFQCHPQIVPLLQLMESDRVTECGPQ